MLMRSRLLQARVGRHMVGVACVIFGLCSVCDRAAAQIVPPVTDPPTEIQPPPQGYPPTTAPAAAGPYFATPAWDQTLAANVRFVILTNFNSHAVLDRETGLVWARQSVISAQNDALVNWPLAKNLCTHLVVGPRGGWRLPTEQELLTLVDFSRPEGAGGEVRLPPGHPFLLAVGPIFSQYWSSDQHEGGVHRYVALDTGASSARDDLDQLFTMCVRGRQ